MEVGVPLVAFAFPVQRPTDRATCHSAEVLCVLLSDGDLGCQRKGIRNGTDQFVSRNAVLADHGAIHHKPVPEVWTREAQGKHVLDAIAVLPAALDVLLASRRAAALLRLADNAPAGAPAGDWSPSILWCGHVAVVSGGCA